MMLLSVVVVVLLGDARSKCCFVCVSHCHTVDIGSSTCRTRLISTKSNVGTHNIFYSELIRYILLPP